MKVIIPIFLQNELESHCLDGQAHSHLKSVLLQTLPLLGSKAFVVTSNFSLSNALRSVGCNVQYIPAPGFSYIPPFLPHGTDIAVDFALENGVILPSEEVAVIDFRSGFLAPYALDEVLRRRRNDLPLAISINRPADHPVQSFAMLFDHFRVLGAVTPVYDTAAFPQEEESLLPEAGTGKEVLSAPFQVSLLGVSGQVRIGRGYYHSMSSDAGLLMERISLTQARLEADLGCVYWGKGDDLICKVVSPTARSVTDELLCCFSNQNTPHLCHLLRHHFRWIALSPWMEHQKFDTLSLLQEDASLAVIYVDGTGELCFPYARKDGTDEFKCRDISPDFSSERVAAILFMQNAHAPSTQEVSLYFEGGAWVPGPDQMPYDVCNHGPYTARQDFPDVFEADGALAIYRPCDRPFLSTYVAAGRAQAVRTPAALHPLFRLLHSEERMAFLKNGAPNSLDILPWRLNEESFTESCSFTVRSILSGYGKRFCNIHITVPPAHLSDYFSLPRFSSHESIYTEETAANISREISFAIFHNEFKKAAMLLCGITFPQSSRWFYFFLQGMLYFHAGCSHTAAKNFAKAHYHAHGQVPFAISLIFVCMLTDNTIKLVKLYKRLEVKFYGNHLLQLCKGIVSILNDVPEDDMQMPEIGNKNLHITSLLICDDILLIQLCMSWKHILYFLEHIQIEKRKKYKALLFALRYCLKLIDHKNSVYFTYNYEIENKYFEKKLNDVFHNSALEEIFNILLDDVTSEKAISSFRTYLQGIADHITKSN